MGEQMTEHGWAGAGGRLARRIRRLSSVFRRSLRDFGPSRDFQSPYFRSAGFVGPSTITCSRLRAAGWPVYATAAEADAVAEPIRASPLFDAAGYAARLGEAAELDPALHYVIVGERMGYAPSAGFDPAYYRDRYPDLARSGMNLLWHYIVHGVHEGRRPVSAAARLTLDRSRLDPNRETVLVICHNATRTGAPVVGYNIAMRLRHRYNVVALFLGDGELVEDFGDCCAAVVGALAPADWHAVDAERVVRRLLESYPISYAVANGINAWPLIPVLARALVPVVLLAHEFACLAAPREAIGQAFDASDQIVFSTDLTAESAKNAYPQLLSRKTHILPQGRCDVPPGRVTESSTRVAQDLRQAVRPNGSEAALVVLGCGTINFRKGVDLFLACAAAVTALRPQRPVRFVWIGHRDPLEAAYPTYLSEQIARSRLEGKVAIIDAIPDLTPAYAMSDVFLLSSRLDPFPNVAIEAASLRLPIVCFENASGMAALLAGEAALRPYVVPYLDVYGAARAIAAFADDESLRVGAGGATQRLAQTAFDMDRYVDRLDELGREAIKIVRQRKMG